MALDISVLKNAIANNLYKSDGSGVIQVLLDTRQFVREPVEEDYPGMEEAGPPTMEDLAYVISWAVATAVAEEVIKHFKEHAVLHGVRMRGQTQAAPPAAHLHTLSSGQVTQANNDDNETGIS